MKKIKIVICTGTTCYVMGGSDLLGLKEVFENDYPGQVELEGCGCLDFCKGDEYCHAPFVKVNDTLLSEATVASVVDEVKRQLSPES